MAQPAYLSDQQILGQTPETADLSRQRRIAELLMTQGMEQPQGQMVSGYYVAPSWTQQIAPLAKAAIGTGLSQSLDEKQQKLAEALRVKGEQEVNDIYELAKTDINAAAKKASSAQTPQGKALAATLMQNALPKKTDLIVNYEAAKNDPVKPFKGSFEEWKNQLTEKDKADLALRKEEVGLSGARLQLEREKAAQELAFGKPLTESQAKATAFQSQMIGAENNIKQLESKGFNPTSLQTQAALKVAGGPLNITASPETQQYKQAQEQWAEAYLRFKTGAAATEPEVQRNIKTFFPQFGDKPAQIAQKTAARTQAEQDIGFAAGAGANRGAQPLNLQPQQPTKAPKKVVNFNDLP
jgi:hypothetical protein